MSVHCEAPEPHFVSHVQALPELPHLRAPKARPCNHFVADQAPPPPELTGFLWPRAPGGGVAKKHEIDPASKVLGNFWPFSFTIVIKFPLDSRLVDLPLSRTLGNGGLGKGAERKALQPYQL